MLEAFRAVGAHYSQYGWFLALWGVPLASLSIAGALSLRSASPPSAAFERGALLDAIRTPAVIALLAFLWAYAYAIVAHEDLVGLDYAQLTAKRFVGMQIWPDNGRFFPLGLQEYNLLALIGKTAWLYHAFSVVELGLMIACVFRLLDQTPIWLRCVTVASMLVVPGIQQSFFGLMFPERDLLFCLAAWLVCVQSFTRTKRRSWWYAALIATQFILYYKEPAFVIVGGFAGLRFAFGAWADRDALRRGDFAATIARHSLEIAMLALCGVFLGIYATAIRPHVTASYVAGRPPAATIGPAFIDYVRSDLILDATIVVFAIRMLAVARGRRMLDPFWDSAAAAALAYALAFVTLGLTHEYYLAPTDLLGSLYLARAGYEALRSQAPVAIGGALIVVALLFQRNLRNDAYAVLNRKQFVAGNVRLAGFLREYARARDTHQLRLFFPQAGGFQLMELSSFLQYKGLHSGGTTHDSASAGFTIVSPHRYPDGRCHPSQEFHCEYSAVAGAGDLVILLPGHSVGPDELAALRASGRELLHFSPRPGMLERTLSIFVADDQLAELSSDAYVFECGPKN
jgi:hypothetical protein